MDPECQNIDGRIDTFDAYINIRECNKKAQSTASLLLSQLSAQRRLLDGVDRL